MVVIQLLGRSKPKAAELVDSCLQLETSRLQPLVVLVEEEVPRPLLVRTLTVN
jgi:hypothetical protein